MSIVVARSCHCRGTKKSGTKLQGCLLVLFFTYTYIGIHIYTAFTSHLALLLLVEMEQGPIMSTVVVFEYDTHPIRG